MKNVLVTGAAGFLGRHLVRRLIGEGAHVWGVDNFYSSQRESLEELKNDIGPDFTFVEHDIREAWETGEVFDEIYHLACPASPPAYARDPLFTFDTCTVGTRHLLELSRKTGATFLFTSTSEIYGDPEVHPQPETYWGNVNTLGPRSCYDVGKRAAETLCYLYRENYKVKLRLARIFNTYGPGMDPRDGRVITNFFLAVKNNTPFPLYGEGQQTRSFCYVDDTIDGLVKLARSSVEGPVNIGNPGEFQIRELASKIHQLFGEGKLHINYTPLPQDDPRQRRPDITRARQELGWSPHTELDQGLKQMFRTWQDQL